MNSSKFLIISTILLVGVVAVLGAPSNSTTGGNKRPPAAQNPKSNSPTTKSPSGAAARGNLAGTPSTPATTTGGKKSNSSSSPHIRVRRDQLTQVVLPSGTGSPSGVDKANSNQNDRNFGTKNITNPRPVRSSSDEEEGHDEESSSHKEKVAGSEDSTGSHAFVPSSHPLFASRTSSNITDTLRPKLRTTPVKGVSGGKAGDESASEEGSETGSDDGTSHKIPHRPQSSHQKVNVKSSTSEEEETVSVVSSGPVGVSGGFSGKITNNTSTPVKGFASGTGGHKRGPASPPKKEEDEDVFF